MGHSSFTLDSFDRKIVDVLAVNGRISVTALAQRIGLSKSPTQARVKRLEDSGVIRGYRALYDPIRLGRDHVAFVEVKLTDTREKMTGYRAILAEKISTLPHVANTSTYVAMQAVKEEGVQPVAPTT